MGFQRCPLGPLPVSDLPAQPIVAALLPGNSPEKVTHLMRPRGGRPAAEPAPPRLGHTPLQTPRPLYVPPHGPAPLRPSPWGPDPPPQRPACCIPCPRGGSICCPELYSFSWFCRHLAFISCLTASETCYNAFYLMQIQAINWFVNLPSLSLKTANQKKGGKRNLNFLGSDF